MSAYRLGALVKSWIYTTTDVAEIWAKHINPLSTKLYLSDLKTHFVPRSKHSASVFKTR